MKSVFKNYGKPEYFWQGVNLCLFAPLYLFLILPEIDNLPVFFGYSAAWLVVGYIFFMIVHGTAGGVATINAQVPVKATVIVGFFVAALCGLAVYFDHALT